MMMIMTRKVVEIRMVLSSNFSSIAVPLLPVVGAEVVISKLKYKDKTCLKTHVKIWNALCGTLKCNAIIDNLKKKFEHN